jgi:hypothetical protein
MDAADVLRATLSTDNAWIKWSTLAVFIGVIVEMADLLLFNKEMTRLQRRILFIATFLIAAGCGGEWYFEDQAAQAESQLQQLSDQKVAQLQAGEAADRNTAQQAAAKAGSLGVTVGTLDQTVRQETARADVLSHETTATVSALDRDRADLDRARVDAQASETKAVAALETIRKEGGSRTLTAAQRAKLAAVLRGALTLSVPVESVAGDVEAYPYAIQLRDALRDAKATSEWQAFPYPFVWFNEPGIYVWEGGGSRAKREGDALLRALKSVGINADEADTPKDLGGPTPADFLALVVWYRKPPTPVPN